MIEMRTKIYRVTKIKTKTKAKFYADVEVGDLIEISLPIESRFSQRYVTNLRVKNLLKGLKSETSLNQISSYLKKYELEETELRPTDIIDIGNGMPCITFLGVATLHGSAEMESCLSSIKGLRPIINGVNCIFIEDYLNWLKNEHSMR